MSMQAKLAVFAVVIALTSPAWAALNLVNDLAAEWNFTVNEDMNYLAYDNGALARDCTLAGTAAVNTGSTGLGTQFVSKVANGYLTVPASWDSTGTNGVYPASYRGEWRRIITKGGVPQESFGQTTVAVVYRPGFSGMAQWTRHTFFNLGDSGATQSIFLFNSDDYDGPGLQLNAGGNMVAASVPSFTWDSSKWYFIAATWYDDADTDPNTANPTRLYVRVLDPSKPAAAIGTSTTDVQKTGQWDFTSTLPYIGVRSGGADEARGDIALTQIYTNYATESDLDALYNSFFIPEPATAGLIALGALIVFARRCR